jgi:predicted ArsR family transcriptional regulator
MTEANARHHLSILREQGLIKEIGLRPRSGRGRPAKVFGLANHLIGDNLTILASVLLDLAESTPQLSLEAVSHRMADKIHEIAEIEADPAAKPDAGFITIPDVHPKNLTQSLNRLTQILNLQHYHSRWEAHIEAPILIFGNCPYSAIIEDHPELCQMDSGIIQQLLGVSNQQTAKMTKDASGLTQCVFRIGNQRV